MHVNPPTTNEGRRYWKFSWHELGGLPQIGEMDYQPKGRAFRFFAEGSFHGEELRAFSAIKVTNKLSPLGVAHIVAATKTLLAIPFN